MTTVPIAVLNRALQALDKSYERLHNAASPDPYLDVVKARSELGYYVNKIMENTPAHVGEVPKYITEGALA
jgi:hypothetical protein